MGAERLLVVEDEAVLAEVIADNLALEGFDVEVVGDGERALERIRGGAPDLVLLDVMLPGMDGFEICSALREERNNVPILFLTARSGKDDRVRGLELGGDDYIGKPFELRELILRVRAILRRTKWFKTPMPLGEMLTIGEATVDLANFRATARGEDFDLSPKEAMILRCLAERPDDVVSRAEILDRVWGTDSFPTARTVDNFIVRLRRVIEPDPQTPRHIHTVRGVGYRLTF
ncbi:MAG: response regulator transcription factor [Planctomycetota bacterium]|nr:response regulator transcription factor [Planctomycetota bacterium]